MVFFFVSAFFYTPRDNWEDLKLYSLIDDGVFSPASPANNYLVEDDLRLFEGISGKRFLSFPWKGLVIGVATHNYPLETKPATLTNKKFSFSKFMNSNCEDKISIARMEEIDYVYSFKFDCPGFELKGSSSEGAYLYEVKS